MGLAAGKAKQKVQVKYKTKFFYVGPIYQKCKQQHIHENYFAVDFNDKIYFNEDFISNF